MLHALSTEFARHTVLGYFDLSGVIQTVQQAANAVVNFVNNVVAPAAGHGICTSNPPTPGC